MTIIIKHIDPSNQSTVDAIDITSLVNAALTLTGRDLSQWFPVGNHTPASWDLDTVLSGLSAFESLLREQLPSNPGFTEKPVSEITPEEQALINKNPHVSITNEHGEHVIRMLNPVEPQSSVATPLLSLLTELSTFLKHVRNQQGHTNISGTTGESPAPVTTPDPVPSNPEAIYNPVEV